MIWDLYQEGRINRAANAADRAESKANRYADDIRSLVRRMDRLTLACQAMWEILRDERGISDEEIERKMGEIDGRDGSVDGKMGTPALACPSCQRPTSSKRPHCMICGAEVTKPHVFES